MLKELELRHNKKYTYPEFNYTKMHDRIRVVCKSHGEFTPTLNSHFRGKGCRKCSDLLTRERKLGNRFSFVANARRLHGSFYNYSLVVYTDAHTKVKIKCPVHGVFEMTPSNHTNSSKPQGCPQCASRIGWTRSAWTNSAKGKKAKLYIIECQSGNEVFYKIGITVKDSIFERYPGATLPYNFKLLKWIESEDAAAIYDLERTLHRLHNNFKHTPKIAFAGDTECFKIILI